jgi:hypothetical protein
MPTVKRPLRYSPYEAHVRREEQSSGAYEVNRKSGEVSVMKGNQT